MPPGADGFAVIVALEPEQMIASLLAIPEFSEMLVVTLGAVPIETTADALLLEHPLTE